MATQRLVAAQTLLTKFHDSGLAIQIGLVNLATADLNRSIRCPSIV